MSEFVQGALVAGGFALAGAFVTQMFSLLLERRREDATYRVNLYDKRLAVHQQGFEWTQKIGGLAFVVDAGRDASTIEEFGREVTLFRDWWNANALYLDPLSLRELALLLPLCAAWVRGDADKAAVSRQIEAAQGAIIRGIGLKHIDFARIRDELRKTREELDAR